MRSKFNKPVKLSLLLETGNLDYVSNLCEVDSKAEDEARRLQARQEQVLLTLVKLQEDITIFEDQLLDSWSRNEIREAIFLSNKTKIK